MWLDDIEYLVLAVVALRRVLASPRIAPVVAEQVHSGSGSLVVQADTLAGIVEEARG